MKTMVDYKKDYHEIPRLYCFYFRDRAEKLLADHFFEKVEKGHVSKVSQKKLARNIDISIAYASGNYTLSKLGKKYKISSARVRQIKEKYMRILGVIMKRKNIPFEISREF